MKIILMVQKTPYYVETKAYFQTIYALALERLKKSQATLKNGHAIFLYVYNLSVIQTAI